MPAQAQIGAWAQECGPRVVGHGPISRALRYCLLGQRSRGSPRNRAKNGNMHGRFTFFSRNCFNEYFEEFE
jgi:hypothetical protein